MSLPRDGAPHIQLSQMVCGPLAKEVKKFRLAFKGTLTTSVAFWTMSMQFQIRTTTGP